MNNNALSDTLNSIMSWNQSGVGNTLNSSMVGSTPSFQTVGSTGSSPGSGGQGQPSWLDRLVGWTDGQGNQQAGWGNLALGGAGALMQGYMGYQQLQMAKDQLSESKRQFNMNWDAQSKLTNSRLADRQRARLSADPNAYESVASYMGKYGINQNA